MAPPFPSLPGTLREIGPVRQDGDQRRKRWFQDDYFDLFVWQDEGGETVAFQLCYARGASEGAISWEMRAGYSHARIDSGEDARNYYGMTPILRSEGSPPYFRIYNRFLDAARGLDPALGGFLLERLREYRHALYGARRKPRRRRRTA